MEERMLWPQIWKRAEELHVNHVLNWPSGEDRMAGEIRKKFLRIGIHANGVVYILCLVLIIVPL